MTSDDDFVDMIRARTLGVTEFVEIVLALTLGAVGINAGASLDLALTAFVVPLELASDFISEAFVAPFVFVEAFVLTDVTELGRGGTGAG